MWDCATTAGARESRTVQESWEVEVGKSNQWRQWTLGDDGKYTRLRGQLCFGNEGKGTRLKGDQATGVLQTVRGEAGSITRREGGYEAQMAFRPQASGFRPQVP